MDEVASRGLKNGGLAYRRLTHHVASARRVPQNTGLCGGVRGFHDRRTCVDEIDGFHTFDEQPASLIRFLIGRVAAVYAGPACLGVPARGGSEV